MSVNFFKDIQLKQSEVSGNYRLHKIGQLYDELQEFESPFYKTTIENPLDIAGDDVCMWIDPSNPSLLNLDANNNLVNNTAPTPFAVADKSQYANNYAVVAGGAGLSYDPDKRMIRHIGGSVVSELQRIGLGSKNPNQFTTTNSPFSYFFVIEQSPFTDFSVNDFRGIWEMGSTGSSARPYFLVFNRPQPSGFAGSGCAWGSLVGSVFQNTGVAHPYILNSNALPFVNGKRVILGYVLGVDGGVPYRDLYYNGIFCGRTTVDGIGTRSANIRFGFGFAGQRFEGWSGEQVLISRALNRTEVIRLNEYLNSKWNVYPVRECDIFVTAGQSNMVGYANGTAPNQPYTTLQTTGSEYGYYCDPQQIYTANETPIACHRGINGGQIQFYLPTTTSATPNDVLVATQKAGHNSGTKADCLSEFAEEYFKKTGRYAVFFKASAGATSLLNPNQWLPSNSNNNLWNRVNIVLNPMKEKLRNNGWKVRSANLLWHQGESDVGANTQQYQDTLNIAFEKVINDFGYDNVFYYIVGATGNSRNAQLTYNPTNPKIRSIFDTNIFLTTRLALENNAPDQIHYNTLGQQMMGVEGGKQVGEIIAKDQTLTLKSVVSVEQPTTIYSREDVRFWGAVGNGINDDTQAIQLAFSNNSRRVYIPSGTYLITGNNDPLTLQNKTNFTLELDGCLFSYTGTGANSNMLSFINNTNLVVKGNSFFRQTTNGANSAVKIQNSNATASNSIFRGFNIQGVNNFTVNPVNQFVNGILVLTGNNTQNANTITECNIRNCQTGISLQTEYYTISNCIITQCSWYGIRVASTAGNFGIDNCNIQANGTGILVLGITGNSDHGTISNCRINHNVFFGIHARQILLSLNISNCDIWANLSGGFTTGYTLGTQGPPETEPFDINNKPAPVAPNTIVSFGIVIDGGRNCVIDGNTIAHNVVNLGYGGCQLSTITGNFFRTDGTRTTNHILEYYNVYGTNTGSYNNSQNTICNNVFAGNLIPSGLNGNLMKAINFYTTPNAYNVVASDYSVKNNTRTTGFNQLNFTTSLPDIQTYIIDPNYDAVNVSLINYGARVLQLSTAMFGTTWDLNVNFPSNPATYAPLNIQITPNYIGAEVPTINCKGISYNSGTKTYTITSAGRYNFSDIGGNNTWVITSNINPIDINTITSDITVSKSNVKNINFVNPASNRTLTFISSNFTSLDVGFTFDVYFSDTTLNTNNDIRVENQLGASATITYINTRTSLKTTIINTTNTNLNAAANDRYQGYRFIYVNGTASDPNEIWRINQF